MEALALHPMPSLRQALIRAVQASDAVRTGYEGTAGEHEMDRREAEADAARTALVVVLADHGIDARLAAKLGEVL